MENKYILFYTLFIYVITLYVYKKNILMTLVNTIFAMYWIITPLIFMFMFKDIPIMLSVPQRIYVSTEKIALMAIAVYFTSFLVFNLIFNSRIKLRFIKPKSDMINKKTLFLILKITSVLYVVIFYKQLGGISNLLHYKSYYGFQRPRVTAFIHMPMIIALYKLNRKKLKFKYIIWILPVVLINLRFGMRLFAMIICLGLLVNFFKSRDWEKFKYKKVVYLTTMIGVIYLLLVPLIRVDEELSVKNILKTYEGNGIYAALLYRIYDGNNEIKFEEGIESFSIGSIKYFIGNKIGENRRTFTQITNDVIAKKYDYKKPFGGNIFIEIYYYFGVFGILIFNLILVYLLTYMNKYKSSQDFFLYLFFPFVRGDWYFGTEGIYTFIIAYILVIGLSHFLYIILPYKSKLAMNN